MQYRNPYEPPQSALPDAQLDSESDFGDRRPVSVECAFWSNTVSAALGFLSFVLRGVQEPLALAAAILTFQLAIGLMIRWGVNWARYLYLTLFILGLPSVLLFQHLLAQLGPYYFTLLCVQTLLQILALSLMFAAPSRRWYRRRRQGSSSKHSDENCSHSA